MIVLPVEVLRNMDLLGWSTILLGLRKGWATREDAIEYAVSLLSDDCDDQHVAIVAGGESLDDDELVSLISKLATTKDHAIDHDKWRLAHLVCIANSDESEQGKIDRLQKAYATFDYPQDMASCSIYAQDRIDPLLAMRRVIEKLQDKLMRN